ncbi:MAG: cytochrome b561 [Polaribacter sp.]|jgi:cytochrome b561
MSLRSNRHAYGTVAKFFHWITAFLFLVTYLTIYYREYVATTDIENWFTIQLHMSIGVSLGGIVLLRAMWRYIDLRLCDFKVKASHLLVIKLGHASLYIIMIVMPLTGILSLINYLTNGGGHIDLFFIYKLDTVAISFFEYTELLLKSVENSSKAVHLVTGQYIAPAFIIGHVTAAFYHHFILRHNTLRKITF